MTRLVLAGVSCLAWMVAGCSTGGLPYSAPAGPSPMTTTAAPVFSVAAGMYRGSQTVSLTDTTARAAIYFTTNGTIPTASSALYTGPITINASEILMAVAIAQGDAASQVTSASYTIVLPDGTVAHGSTPIAGAHVYLLAGATNGYGKPSTSLLNPASTGTSDSVGAYVTTDTAGRFFITGMYQWSEPLK